MEKESQGFRVKSSGCCGLRSSNLLIQNGLPHDSILASHSSPKRAFNLCTKGQLAKVVAFLWCRDEALL
jgi:hypothetical protein